MSLCQPFMPVAGNNQILTAGAASQTANILKDSKQLRILNTGAAIAYIRTFYSAQAAAVAASGVATTADYPVAAGQASTISTGSDHDRIAYISATGTTLQVICGDGW